MKFLKIKSAKEIGKQEQKSINGGIGTVDNGQPNPCGASPGVFFFLTQSACDRNGGIFYNNKCYFCN